MDMHSAKLGTLQQIINMMDGHMLGGLKKKGEQPKPAAVALTVEGGKPEDAPPLDGATDPESPDEEKSEEGDDDLIKQLVEHYSKEDDEEDMTPTKAVPMA